MLTKKNKEYGKNTIIIYPGEYYASSDDEIISTILGSCVSICLYDHKNMFAGMNHFMLPGRIIEADLFKDRSARYGITATYELFSSMKKLGSDKKNIVGKIFGGGNLIKTEVQIKTVPFDNIRLAKILLEMEDIPIVEMDVGGSYSRKILMEVKSGRVYLKKSTKTDLFNKIELQNKRHSVE